MLAKLSVDQALTKARSHTKNGEFEEAQKLYQAVSQALSKQAKDKHQGLATLNKPKENNTIQSPPQEAINQLANLYKQGHLSSVVEEAKALTEQYPGAFIIWHILGSSASQIGMPDLAITAFKKVISLKPDYADAYNNLGIAYQNQGRIEEAIEAFTKALSIQHDLVDAWNNIYFYNFRVTFIFYAWSFWSRRFGCKSMDKHFYCFFIYLFSF